MITPTGITPAEYWSAIKSGNHTHLRMTFIDQNIVLSDEDVSLSGGLQISDIFNGDTDLVMGNALSKQISVSILNSSKVAHLVWTSEFSLEMGVDTYEEGENDEIITTTNWVTIGYFIGEKPNNVTSTNVIEFTAYDRMQKFDVLADGFISGFSFPATVQGIYDALCAYVGMSNEAGNELPNIMSRYYNEAPVDFEGYTCREVLAWIAEACGCYAKINADGNVQMVWFTDHTNHIITGDEEFHIASIDINEGFIWNEADQMTWDEIEAYTWNEVSGFTETYRVDELKVKQINADIEVNYPNDLGSNIYTIAGNPFLTVVTAQNITDYIVPIYNRLETFGGYMPIQIDCIGSWLVEAGDIVTIHAFDHVLSVPIFVKSMRWNGSTNDTYETTGNVIRPVYASEKTREKVMTSKEIKLLVNGAYYEKKNGIVINDEGVSITGQKSISLDSDGEVLIRAGHEYNKWNIDRVGLQFEGHAIVSDNPNPTKYITFGISQFTGEYIPEVESGLFPQYTENANFVNLILKVWKERSDSYQKYAYLHLDAINTADSDYSESGTQIALWTDGHSSDGSVTGCIGLSYAMWRHIYGETVHYWFLDSMSSREVKNDIKALPDFGDAIDKLAPVSFQYKHDPRNRTVFGLVYEDTVDIMPEICTTGDKKKGDEEPTDKGINYMALIPILLKEIQSLRKRVSDLEIQIKNNKGR